MVLVLSFTTNVWFNLCPINYSVEKTMGVTASYEKYDMTIAREAL